MGSVKVLRRALVVIGVGGRLSGAVVLGFEGPVGPVLVGQGGVVGPVGHLQLVGRVVLVSGLVALSVQGLLKVAVGVVGNLALVALGSTMRVEPALGEL